MSYTANLGRDNIIKMLRELGATDVQFAAGRAALRGHVETARMLYALAGRPRLPKDAVMGPCEAVESGRVGARFGAGRKHLRQLGGLSRAHHPATRNLFEESER